MMVRTRAKIQAAPPNRLIGSSSLRPRVNEGLYVCRFRHIGCLYLCTIRFNMYRTLDRFPLERRIYPRTRNKGKNGQHLCPWVAIAPVVHEA